MFFSTIRNSGHARVSVPKSYRIPVLKTIEKDIETAIETVDEKITDRMDGIDHGSMKYKSLKCVHYSLKTIQYCVAMLFGALVVASMIAVYQGEFMTATRLIKCRILEYECPSDVTAALNVSNIDTLNALDLVPNSTIPSIPTKDIPIGNLTTLSTAPPLVRDFSRFLKETVMTALVKDKPIRSWYNIKRTQQQPITTESQLLVQDESRDARYDEHIWQNAQYTNQKNNVSSNILLKDGINDNSFDTASKETVNIDNDLNSSSEDGFQNDDVRYMNDEIIPDYANKEYKDYVFDY